MRRDKAKRSLIETARMASPLIKPPPNWDFDRLGIRELLRINNQIAIAFRNQTDTGYLFSISTNSNDELYFYDQGSKNIYRFRTTLTGGGTADLLWSENSANQSLLDLGLGTAGGRLAMGSEFVVTAKGSGGGATALGLGIGSPAEKLHVYDGNLKVEGNGFEDVTGGTIYLQNKPSLIPASPADNDVAGLIRALGINSAGNPIIIADIYFQITDVTAGSEDGAVRIVTQKDYVDAFVFNAVRDRVGINELSPTATLHVGGDLLVDTADTIVATFGDGTGPKVIDLDGGAGQVRDIRYRSNGVNRFVVRVNSGAETGSDAGSNLDIYGYDDGGAALPRAFSVRRSDGSVLIGAPGGSYKGYGTINTHAVYDDNTLLTPYVLEAARNGRIDLPALDAKVPNRTIPPKMRVIPAVTRTIPARKVKLAPGTDRHTGKPTAEKIIDIPERVEVIEPEREEEIEPAGIEERIHGPARRFVAHMEEELDPVRYAAKWKRDGHLPAFPSEAEWVEKGNFSTGDLVQRLMETVEVQAVHIDRQQQALATMEARLAVLERGGNRLQ